MLQLLATSALSLIEKELIKHEPEVQQRAISELDNLAKLLFDYVQKKLIDSSSEKPNNSLEG